jgi:hypothetical protein
VRFRGPIHVRTTLPVAVCAVLLGTVPALAHTWRVEKDGSGDFTTIQPAINVSAVGDTIEIGPGRYTENALFSPQPGSWVERTYVGIVQEDLTIRGSDRDAVIIGPTTPNFTTYGPKGFATHSEIQRVRIENLTVENVHDGMYLGGGRWGGSERLRSARMQYRHLWHGRRAAADPGMRIQWLP